MAKPKPSIPRGEESVHPRKRKVPGKVGVNEELIERPLPSRYIDYPSITHDDVLIAEPSYQEQAQDLVDTGSMQPNPKKYGTKPKSFEVKKLVTISQIQQKQIKQLLGVVYKLLNKLGVRMKSEEIIPGVHRGHDRPGENNPRERKVPKKKQGDRISTPSGAFSGRVIRTEPNQEYGGENIIYESDSPQDLGEQRIHSSQVENPKKYGAKPTN